VSALLCADIGNSHTTLGLLDDGDVVDHWRVATDERRTADEWGVLLRSLLHDSPVPGPLRGVAVCATVPAVLHEWREMLRTFHGDLHRVVVEPGVRTGLPVLMDNPREVGTDRIANALAAVTLYGAPCLVVDVGTAITIDVVNPAGAFIGGVIAPGIETATDALGQAAAQLRRVELVRPRSVVAKNTVEALQSGAIHGFAALVDGLVARIRTEQSLNDDLPVVLTGALAPLLTAELTTPVRDEPFLTLRGLYQAYTRNYG
jgi:type III pantothenate kinase